MALPAGTYNRPDSGTLQITFSGVWSVNESDWRTGTWDIVLRGIVTYGAVRKTVLLNIQNNSATVDLDYTGGEAVSVALEKVSHTFGGAGIVRARMLLIRCRIHKLSTP